MRDAYRHVYQDEIKRYFNKRYGNKRRYRKGYLTTYWWYIISHKRKLMDRFTCAVDGCGNQDNLQVHHWGYEHMGEEIKFMDDIVTLCETCHENQHPDMRKRVLNRKRRKPKKVVNLKDFHEKIEIIREQQQYVITVQDLTTDELWEIIQRDFDLALDALEKQEAVH